MPSGELETVPLPLPVVLTVRVRIWTKVAVTVVAAVKVTVQESVPVQAPPLHPLKMVSAAGLAVRVTRVPVG